MKLVAVVGLLAVMSLPACGSGKTTTVVQTVTVPATTTGNEVTDSATTPEPTTTATVAPPIDPATATCAELHMTRRTGAHEGTCHDPDGTKYVTVNKSHTVKLKTLTARLNGIRVVDSVSTDDGYISETASGKFVILSVTITNRTSSPQVFEGSGNASASLAIDSGVYSQDFDASNQADPASFVSQDDPIQPGGSKTGDLIFDLPSKRVPKVYTQGVLSLINLGADSETTRTVGLIRLYK
jgi:hypothetical protein